MNPHPCAGHECDECWTCRAGICCGSISADQLVQLEAERRLAVVMAETQATVALPELVRREAEVQERELTRTAPRALPATPQSILNIRREVMSYAID